MDEYADYIVTSSDGSPDAGICHLRGANADPTSQWMIYVIVDDLEASLSAAEQGIGARIGEIRGDAGARRFCIISDPSGAVLGLMENPGEDESGE